MVEPLEVSKKMTDIEILRSFGDGIEKNKSLAEFSTFKTGGKAKYFITVKNSDEIVKAINDSKKHNIPYFIIGGGSNLLISDKGYAGLIIKIDVKGINLISETEIESGSGENLMDVVEFSAEKSLTGLEFASGIAGSLGGAVIGNAGAFGGEIKDVLAEITLIDSEGKLRNISPDECQFAYRDSQFKRTNDVITSVKFNLKAGDKNKIREKIDEILALRKSKHPDKKSAGSFFKNIPDPNEKYGKMPAGRLLEEIGAKGMTVGGAAVYEKHANIIINKDNATSKDIKDLADMLKKKVYDRFGISLEEEVITLGEF